MRIPTEPIGSIPRPERLLRAQDEFFAGGLDEAALEALADEAMRETIREFEATGSPVISDGEQHKYASFATYAVHGLSNLDPEGFHLQFTDHDRVFPRLTAGPLRYRRTADVFLAKALKYARVPVKQAVIAPSMVSLFYPAEPLPSYPRTRFVEDVLAEHEREVRACLELGAHSVQIDFTEGRLACRLDRTGFLLRSWVTLNNLALRSFSAADRRRLGVHTCPGADCDTTHSGDVDYAELLPSLFEIEVGSFFVELAREPDPERVLGLIKQYMRADQRVFVGVIDPLDPRVETPEEVRDRVLRAARYIPPDQLGTTDDCGFAPFCDDQSTSRETAFAKIRARVLGTAMASEVLGGRS